MKFTSSIISKRYFNFTDEVLNEVLELKIITMLMANEKKGQKEIAEDIDCSYYSVQKCMKSMINKGLLVRNRGRRSGCWKVIKPINDHNRPKKTDDTEQLISGINSPNESGNGGINGGLKTEFDHQFLKVILSKPNATQKELAERMNISLRAVQRKIKQYQENGIIERKNGYWQINCDQNDEL